jgi:hypothetical protein
MATRIALALLAIVGLAAVASATVPNPNPSVPEPSMLTLLASGVGGALLYVRNRRSKK